MISKELVEENKKKLLDERRRIKVVLKHEDIADPEFPGGFKPRFDEVGSEEGENASEVENFATNLALAEDLEMQLKKIESALARIENGSYGLCAMGDEIEEQRLRALPEADTCIKHAK